VNCVWLFLAIEIRWVGERLPPPPRPKKQGWWLCWLGADIVANGRFDERRLQLMAIACRSHREANEKYEQIHKQVQIPSGSVLVQRISESDYMQFVKEDEAACKALNEQFSAPVWSGDCLDRRVKR
jgi:hypothetical protein